MPATASELARFNIPEIITFEPGAGELIKAVITAPDGEGGCLSARRDDCALSAGEG